MSYYQFEPPVYSLDGQPLPNLAVLNASASCGSELGGAQYRISGLIRNDQGRGVDWIEPVGTLYDGGGTVVGCDCGTGHSISLAPGQTTPFSIAYSDRPECADVRSYRLQVGRRAQ